MALRLDAEQHVLFREPLPWLRMWVLIHRADRCYGHRKPPTYSGGAELRRNISIAMLPNRKRILFRKVSAECDTTCRRLGGCTEYDVPVADWRRDTPLQNNALWVINYLLIGHRLRSANLVLAFFHGLFHAGKAAVDLIQIAAGAT